MGYTRRKAGARARIAALVLLCGTMLGLGACAGRPTIRMRALEAAPPADLMDTRRIVVGELDSLGEIYQPLCPRLGLLQIRSADDWQRLRRAAPGLGACPDLARGAVVGIVSCAGTPLDGGWPIEIVDVRAIDGAAYLSAEFQPGTYLADGYGCASLAQCRNLRAVLMVDINGVRYFTE